MKDKKTNGQIHRLNRLLGGIFIEIIMGIIYFLLVTPIAIITNLFRRDPLLLKERDVSTYWLKKDENKQNMKNQF